MINVELKPCPFCGGKAVAHSWHDAVKEVREVPAFQDDYGILRHTETVVIAKGTIGEVFCQSCEATIRFVGKADEDRRDVRQLAIEAWNIRYEQQKNMCYPKKRENDYLYDCSKCGGWMPQPPDSAIRPEYCMWCGTKVIY